MTNTKRGRPKYTGLDVKIPLVKTLRKRGYSWRGLAVEYYSITGQEVSFHTLRNRFNNQPPMVSWKLDGCPRCGGDMKYEHYLPLEPEYSCLQCGYQAEA
ncbi:hypothetical protein KKF61_06955 [Patescibacteria group bacterium]|nr:hypothetical protein [Patescibacteria group bacterium]